MTRSHTWRLVGTVQILVALFLLFGSVVVMGGIVCNGLIILAVAIFWLIAGFRSCLFNAQDGQRRANLTNLGVCLLLIVLGYAICRSVAAHGG